MAESNSKDPAGEMSDQTPTPEDLQAAELAKTKQALLVAHAMQQTEAQLAGRLPTQPTQPPPPAPVQPPGTPLPMPVSHGRMYMGPAMSLGQEQAFMQSPSG